MSEADSTEEDLKKSSPKSQDPLSQQYAHENSGKQDDRNSGAETTLNTNGALSSQQFLFRESALAKNILPAMEIMGAPAKPTEVPKPPVIIKTPDGKITVTGEAKLTNSPTGEVKIERLDQPVTGIEIKRTKDGGISYDHHGSHNADNFKCTITPDGKGGNIISWIRPATERGKEQKLDYHWSPTNVFNAPPPGLKPRAEIDKNNSENATEIAKNEAKTLDSIKNISALVAPVNTLGTLLADNGKGTRLYRSDEFTMDKTGKLLPTFKVTYLDSQQNQITISDDGLTHIENPRTHSQYTLIPTNNGYHMVSRGPTADNILNISLMGDIKETKKKDDLIIIEEPDGRKDIIKVDINRTTTWFSDGRQMVKQSLPNGIELSTTRSKDLRLEEILEEKPDGSTSRWSYFSSYPEGAFALTLTKPDGEITFCDGASDPKIAEQIKTLAKVKREELKAKYDIGISAAGDGKLEGVDGLSQRSPTLRELQILEEILENYPMGKDENYYFTFLDGKHPKGMEGTQAFYMKEGAIYVLPQDGQWLQDDSKDFDPNKSKSFKYTWFHELDHHNVYREDPKAFDSGIDEFAAMTNEFERVEVAATHKREWAVKGTELIEGQKRNFYYVRSNDFASFSRINEVGKYVDKEGKIVSTPEPISFDEITGIAKEKFLTWYSYTKPREKRAETYAMYATSQQTQERLLKHDQKYKRNDFAQIKIYDQALIDRYKPADKISPDGYMRIPSGKIVPRTSANEKLVLDFIRKHNPSGT